MTIIYVVTEGEYSDYGIRAVFSTHNKAAEFIAKQRRADYCNIEEYDLDQWENAVATMVYSARIDLDTGELSTTRPSPYVEVVPSSRWSVRTLGTDYAYAESAVSQEHADKLAVEARQQWLREKGTA